MQTVFKYLPGNFLFLYTNDSGTQKASAVCAYFLKKSHKKYITFILQTSEWHQTTEAVTQRLVY